MKTFRDSMLVALLLLMGANLDAQLVLRPMVGVNSARFTTDFSDETFKSQLGYQVGADLMIGGRLYVAPGVMFEVTRKTIEEIGGEAYSVDLQRIDIPVHVGFKIIGGPVDRAFDIRIFAGPNLALNLNKDVEFSENFNADNLKDAMWGWDLGLGVDFFIFFVEGGYRFGLSDVFGNAVENDSKQDVFFGNGGVRIRF